MTIARSVALAAAVVSLVTPSGAASAAPDGGTRNGYTQQRITPKGLSVGGVELFDDRIYFAGSQTGDGYDGGQLWRTTFDRRAGDTSELVAELGEGSRGPDGLTSVGDALYFSVYDDDHGLELWRYDSTTDETGRVTDLDDAAVIDPTTQPDPPEPDGSSSPQDLTPVGDTLYFTADHGASEDLRDLYSLDAGSDDVDIVGSDADGPRNPRDLVVFGDDLYYSANNPEYAPGQPFRVLWHTDTTTGASEPVADVSPSKLVTVGPWVYFFGSDDADGDVLWRYDTGAGHLERVSVIAPEEAPGFPQDLTRAGGVLFFTADDGVHGEELWRSDPATGRTRMVSDVADGAEGSDPLGLTATKRFLYFNADDGRTGAELWRAPVDGGRAEQVADLNPGRARSFPRSMSAIAGIVYFEADGPRGGRVWATRARSGRTVVAFSGHDIGIGAFGVEGVPYYVPLSGKGIHRIDPPQRG